MPLAGGVPRGSILLENFVVRLQVIIAALCSAILMVDGYALCQEDPQNREQARQIAIRYIDSVADRFGIAHDSDAYREMLRQLDAPDTDDSSAQQDTSDEEPPLPNLPTVRHLSVDSSEALAFAKPDEEKPQLSEDLMRDVRENGSKVSDDVQKVLAPPRDMPRCTGSRTTRIPLTPIKGVPAQIAIMDVLYIARSDLPEDTEMFLGKNVQVKRYNTDPNNPVFHEMGGSGVTCLPSRVRLSGKFKIIDEGLNALKNYDRDPNGAGTLDKFFKDYRL